MKQTAVEWLVSELMEKDLLLVFGNPSVDNDAIKIIEQAKEMEEEQIVSAHINGQSEFDNGAYRQEVVDNGEQYYNETFNTKER